MNKHFTFLMMVLLVLSQGQLFSNTGISSDYPTFENRILNEVSEEWSEVYFNEPIDDPVVICTPIITGDEKYIPAIRGISDQGFQIKLISASPSQIPLSIKVMFMAFSKGSYAHAQGLKLEAGQTTVEPSRKSDWNSVKINPIVNFKNPVVFGQVIFTEDDPSFLSFYSHGKKRDYVVKDNNIHIGALSGEYQGEIPAAIEVNYLIIESGHHYLGDGFLSAEFTPASVYGINNSYVHTTSKLVIEGLALGLSSVRGSDGGFPVVIDSEFPNRTSTDLVLAVSEDTFNDSEINHTNETLALAIFSNQLPKPTFNPSPVAVFPESGGEVSILTIDNAKAHYTLDDSEPTSNTAAEYTAPLQLNQDTTVKAITSLDSHEESLTSKLDVFILESNGLSLSQGFISTDLNWVNSIENVTYDTVPDLSGSSPKLVKTELKDLSTEVKDYSIKVIDAYIAIPESDTYTFQVERNSSTAAAFYIGNLDDAALSLSILKSRMQEVQVFLEKGYHPIRLEVLNNYWRGGAKVRWKYSKLNSFQIIPSFHLYYAQNELQNLKDLTDSDGDGLTDLEELALGTNINSKDSDKDGLSDYDEVNLYLTDALSSDSDLDGISDYDEAIIFNSLNSDNPGAITGLIELAGSDYSSKTGIWSKEQTTLRAKKYRGDVSYNIELQESDMVVLDVLGGAYREQDANKPFDISVYVDGMFIGQRTLQSHIDTKNDKFGMTFSGTLSIQVSGNHQFELSSDDGSQLMIDDELIIDHDGMHSYVTKTGTVYLEAGLHKIEVLYFENAGQENLSVKYSGPEFSMKDIDQTDLEGQLEWHYYEGTWSQLPNFDALSSLKSGTCDGFDLSVRTTIIPDSSRFITPFLSAGTHNVKIVWNNFNYNKFLMIDRLLVSSVDGLDEDGNGIKDWIDNKLNIECSISSGTASKTSPLCLEGKGPYLGLMNISTGSTLLKGAGEAWFSNVSLSADSDTEVIMSFQNGAKSITQNLQWIPTYVPAESETLLIRLGDSLLLNPNAGPIASLGNIIIDDQTFSLAAGESLPYQFDEAGEFEITSQYLDETGSVRSATMLVQVIGADLPDQTQVGIVGNERRLDLSVATSISLDADPRLNAFYQVDDTQIAFGMDSIQEKQVLARLGENGPILDVMTLSGIRSVGASRTWFYVSETLEDETKVMNMGVVADPVLSYVEVHVDVFLAGVVLDDGSRKRILTTEDFDELDESEIILLKTPEARKTAACHHVNIYQNGEFVGRAY